MSRARAEPAADARAFRKWYSVYDDTTVTTVAQATNHHMAPGRSLALRLRHEATGSYGLGSQAAHCWPHCFPLTGTPLAHPAHQHDRPDKS